jgi:hypothetical protein
MGIGRPQIVDRSVVAGSNPLLVSRNLESSVLCRREKFEINFSVVTIKRLKFIEMHLTLNLYLFPLRVGHPTALHKLIVEVSSMAVRFRHTWFVVSAVVGSLLFNANAQATIIASSDFSTFAPGDLVGQNGWQQQGGVATSPIQVAGGAVTWARQPSVDNQDAVLPFATVIPAPIVGTTTLNYDLLLNISTVGASPSYFAALNVLNDNSVGSPNFANARFGAQASGAGFVFGTRVTGQGGYPFAFSTDVFNFNQTYALRAEVNMVPGAQNDFIRLFVGNDFNSLTPQATSLYTPGTGTTPLMGTDPVSYGAIVLSQFDNNGTAIQSGVSINSVSVTNITAIPEPSSIALLGFASASIGFLTYRRRRICS